MLFGSCAQAVAKAYEFDMEEADASACEKKALVRSQQTIDSIHCVSVGPKRLLYANTTHPNTVFRKCSRF